MTERKPGSKSKKGQPPSFVYDAINFQSPETLKRQKELASKGGKRSAEVRADKKAREQAEIEARKKDEEEAFALMAQLQRRADTRRAAMDEFKRQHNANEHLSPPPSPYGD